MTAQTTETIYYKGERKDLCSEPLEEHLDNIGVSKIDRGNRYFVVEHTGCWRGYHGTWEVRDKKLYLIRFEGNIGYDEKNHLIHVDIKYLFPDQDEVFAEWYSGKLRIVEGNLMNYVHGGYDSTYERDIFLTFKNGVLVKTRKRDNNSLMKRFFRYLFKPVTRWMEKKLYEDVELDDSHYTRKT